MISKPHVFKAVGQGEIIYGQDYCAKRPMCNVI